MDRFVHLHRHSDFSLLDGTGSADEYVEVVKELNQPALAITDHGNLSGAIHHAEACYANNIKPLIGMEAYFKPDRSLQDKDHKKANHTTLWSLNLDGFHNLMRLSSEAHTTGFYYKPCADWELFGRYSQGLAVSTGCIAGPVPQAILAGDDKSVKAYCDKLQKIFKDNVFVEIMPHAMDDIRRVNIDLINIANERGWPIIATVDAHYPRKDWAPTQDIMLMMNTGQTIRKRKEQEEKGEDVYKFDIDTLYVMNRAEVERLFEVNHPNITPAIVQQACDNTLDLTNRVSPFLIDKSRKMPKVTLDKPIELEIQEWCEEGLVRIGKTNDKTYRDRLEYELNILTKKNVLDYFYLVGDLVRWSKEAGIRVGVGRGSAAGCLVSYLIGITNIDPISYGLLFERFLNPDRASMPDIDLDFQHDRREEAKQHLADKWGQDYVVDIAAFQTFQAKSAIKDVARVLDVPLDVVTPVTNELDDFPGVNLEDVDLLSDRIKRFAAQYPEVWSHAIRLQGKTKSQSKHPAGVVVTDKPVTDYMPIMRGKNGDVVTQWAETLGFNAVTEYGFLKVDVLATDGLTRQQLTLDLIRERNNGEIPDIDNLRAFVDPTEVDEAVMDNWRKGDTFGVFQFQSEGITRLIKQMQPTTLEDIAAANALYRPGPLQSGTAFEYGRRKNGDAPVEYWHSALEPHMNRTYGLLVYQEQVMKVCEHLGGFTLAEADTVRKAITKWIGKRGTQYLVQYQQKFVDGAMSRGIGQELAEDIWDKLTQFASYAFNASHSAGYAAQAYQDMLLKTHYPVEFYTSLLTLEPAHVARAIREAKNKGIDVLPPDINVSRDQFTIDADSIRFGLEAIKFVGNAAVQEIVRVRDEDGPFKSYEDFCERVKPRKCNQRVKDSLINAGAFDCFDMRSDWTEEQVSQAEVELLGMNLSVEVVSPEMSNIIDECSNSYDDFIVAPKGTMLIVGGEVVTYTHRQTKAKKDMCLLSLHHKGITTDVVVFPNIYYKYVDDLKVGNVLMIKGEKDDRGGLKASIISPVADILEYGNV